MAKLRLLTCVAMAWSVIATAQVAEWISLGQVSIPGEVGDYYVNSGIYRDDTPYIKAWSKIVYRQSNSGKLEDKLFADYDCANRRYRFTEMNIFYSNGVNKNIKKEEKEAIWDRIDPDSMAEKAWNYVCYRTKP